MAADLADPAAHLDELRRARARLDLGLAVFGHVHERRRRRMLDWLDLMVRDALHPGAGLALSAVAEWRRRRLAWRVAGERSAMEPALASYLGTLGRGARYASIVSRLRELASSLAQGARLGGWLETSAHGLEAGFFAPHPMAMDQAVGFLPQGHDRQAVDVWAKEYGVERALALTMSAHLENPWIELVLPLPGPELLDQLVAARVLFRALDMPVPDDRVYGAALDLATGHLCFVLGLSAQGPMRIGLAVHQPRPDAIRALASAAESESADHAARHALAGMLSLCHALGAGPAPASVAWLRDATGQSRELTFQVLHSD